MSLTAPPPLFPYMSLLLGAGVGIRFFYKMVIFKLLTCRKTSHRSTGEIFINSSMQTTDKINDQEDVESTLGISLESSAWSSPSAVSNTLLGIRYCFQLPMARLLRVLPHKMRNISSQNSSRSQIQRQTSYLHKVSEGGKLV